jgi:nucleoside-diphosphate-sugar epimerase
MKILVTGATGFIGGRVVERLLSIPGNTVVCTGRSEPKRDLLSSSLQVEFLKGDFDDSEFALRAMKGVEAVIHCAGKAGTWGEYEAYYKANVDLTDKILKAAQSSATKRFINISSPSIYFDFKDQLNLKEGDLPAQFSNHYARTKYEAEKLVATAQNESLDTVSLRPRFVVGAGDHTVLPRIIKLQKSGWLFQIGNGKNIVDVTSISNLLDAIVLCLNAPREAMGETYNICNGEPLPFWKLVDLVLKSVGIEVRRKRISKRMLMAIARANEWVCRNTGRKEEPDLLPISVGVVSQSMTLNIDKAKSKLGYSPRQPIEDAIAEFSKWWLTKDLQANRCP